MLASESTAWELRPKLRPEMFQDAWHGTIFTTMCGLMDEGKRPTSAAISSRIGYEREDGQSVPVLLAIFIGEAKDQSPGDYVSHITETYRFKAFRAILKAADKAAVESGLDAGIHALTPALDDLNSHRTDGPVSIQSVVSNVIRKATSGARAGGLSTGIRSLDDMIGQMYPGQLWAIGGAPGAGKTVIGAQILRHMAASAPALVVELEMDEEDLATRYLSSDTEMSAKQVRAGDLDMWENERLRAAESGMANLPLEIWDKAGLTIEEIVQMAASRVRTKGLKVVATDHLRLIQTRKKFQSKWDRYEYVTMTAKQAAKDLDILWIMLSQLTKGSQRAEHPVPHLTDLDGGGALEQDADGAVVLFRRDIWIRETKLGGQYPDRHAEERTKWMDAFFDCEGVTEAHLVKNRSGATGQKAKLRLEGKFSRFVEI